MSRRRKLLFILFSQVLLLCLLEAGVRVFYAVTDTVPPIADRSLEREWEWVRRHQRSGQTLFQSDAVYDPLLGWRNQPDLDTDLVRTNSAGMRADREFDPDRVDGRRILFVGDSYTFSPFVSNAESFVGQVGALLTGWDVLNLGVNGYGTDQALLAYEQRGRAYAPKVVVMGYFVRDYTRNLVTFTDYAKPRFVLDGSGVRLTGVPVITPETLLAAHDAGERRIGGASRSYAVELVRRSLGRLERHDMDAEGEGWQLLARLMARFPEAVRSDGAVPIWIVIPGREVVESAPSRFDPLAARCLDQAEALALQAQRIGPAFRTFSKAHPDDPLYRPSALGGHLTARGNAVLADEVVRFLRSEGLVD